MRSTKSNALALHRTLRTTSQASVRTFHGVHLADLHFALKLLACLANKSPEAVDNKGVKTATHLLAQALHSSKKGPKKGALDLFCLLRRGRDTETCISGQICVTFFATEFASSEFWRRMRRKEKATCDRLFLGMWSHFLATSSPVERHAKRINESCPSRTPSKRKEHMNRCSRW